MIKTISSALLLVILQITPALCQPETFDARIRDLISKMTHEEKIQQTVQTAPAIPRLGIPAYNWQSECLHGIIDDSVTVFPQSIGLAAMWDPALIFRIATAISDEGRIVFRQRGNGMSYWSPNLNMVRDPRWGRTQETFGEDPFLSSRIAVEFIKGLQGNDPRYWKTIASPKHFCVHSGPEPIRYTLNAKVNEKEFWEYYMPVWKAAFTEGKAHGVMTAYNAVNGVPNSANTYFLRDILREKWGFEGYVVSDCGAIVLIIWGLGYAGTQGEAVSKAMKAGCDLECGVMYSDHLQEGFDEGFLVESDLDSAMYHLLWTRFKLGLFEPEDSVQYNKIPDSKLCSKEFAQLSHKAAQESIVLLKNDNNTLPFKKNYDSILVVGPNAKDRNFGSYSGGSPYAVTILDGIKQKVPAKTKVNYIKGCDKVGYFTELMPVKYMKTPDGKPGLKGEYFNNNNFSGSPALTRIDTLINFNWLKGSPDPKINSDSFCIRWSGFIHADSTDIYTLKLRSDDGVRFYFNDTMKIDDWTNHSTLDRITILRMEAGKEYPVVIEYFDNIVYADVRFEIGTIKSGKSQVDSIIAIAKNYDAIIFAGGLGVELEMEHLGVQLPGFEKGDRTSLDLPEIQVKLLNALKKCNKPLVLVMQNGSSMSINEPNDSIPAIIEMWYGSQEGGTALADIIFGDYNPSGRLPLTFYKSVDDLPDFLDYSIKGRTYRYSPKEPLYPFGYGLSYTTFKYKSMELPIKEIEIGEIDTLTVKFNISNDGKMDGDEVVQLYCRSLDSKYDRPIKWLVGFKRINIKAGKTNLDSIKLNLNELAVYDTLIKDFYLEPASFELQLSSSAADIRLMDTIKLKQKIIIGIDQNEEFQFNIWPNPASNIIDIEFYNIPPTDFKFNIFDLLGNRVTVPSVQRTGINRFRADISGLVHGTYYLLIETGTKRINKRFVVRY
jgi:beta-glucosidase